MNEQIETLEVREPEDEVITEARAEDADGALPISEEAAEAADIIEDEPAEEPFTEAVDYEALAREDLRELQALFPEARSIGSITELDNPTRYAALRDLGLTPKEAYLATRNPHRTPDNRRHLSSAVPRGAGAPAGSMTRSELERARDLFPGLGDRELVGLYRRVSH